MAEVLYAVFSARDGEHDRVSVAITRYVAAIDRTAGVVSATGGVVDARGPMSGGVTHALCILLNSEDVLPQYLANSALENFKAAIDDCCDGRTSFFIRPSSNVH